MTLNGTYTATVDRITEGIATVLIESDGHTVGQTTLDVDDLPDGATEGAVLTVTFADGSLADLEHSPGETSDRQKAAQDRFDRLSTRLSDRQN